MWSWKTSPMFARCWWLESNSILEPELEKALDDAVQGEPKHLIVNLKGHIRYGPDRGEGSLTLARRSGRLHPLRHGPDLSCLVFPLVVTVSIQRAHSADARQSDHVAAHRSRSRIPRSVLFCQ